jgi:aminoglycoside phosphotransferase (APT) family kinase protein
MEISDSKIKLIFQTSLHEEVINISDASKGLDQIVKIVETASGKKYAFKSPKNPKEKELIYREVFACEKLKGKAPVPEIFFKSDDYIIKSFLEGEDLCDVVLSEEQAKDVYCEVGRCLKKIHQIKTQGFGSIGLDGVGEFKTLRPSVTRGLNKKLFYLWSRRLLMVSEIIKLKKYLKVNGAYFDSGENVMLHFDYEDYHIKLKNGKVCGIFDFGDLSAGPRALDLARQFISHFNDGHFQYILDGYGGGIDLKEVEFHAVLTLIWMAKYHHDKNNNKYRRDLEVIREILK